MNNYIIGLDFDGTVVEHCYPQIGPPVPGCLDWLKKLQNLGAVFILNTMRSDDELDKAAAYLEKNGIRLYGRNVNPSQHEWTGSPKPYAHVYVDDSAIGVPLLPSTVVERMMVNWSIIGPDLYSRCLAWNRSLGRNLALHITVGKDGSWFFSDYSTGLVREPFVSGADTLLAEASGEFLQHAQKEGIVAVFTGDHSLPIKLTRDEIEDESGNWYTTECGFRAWLCPALYKYFHTAPEKLSFKVFPA